MSSFLLGLPGKVKALLDRLTALRAGYLDHLPILPGSLLQAPTTEFVLPVKTRTAWAAVDYTIVKENSGGGYASTTSSSFVDAVNITGQGVLNLAISGGSGSYFPGSAVFEVEIDGIILTYVNAIAAEPLVAVGTLDPVNRAVSLDQIPFRSSLIIRIKSNGAVTHYCVYKYRITG